MEREQYIEQIATWLEETPPNQAMLIWTFVRGLLKK